MSCVRDSPKTFKCFDNSQWRSVYTAGNFYGANGEIGKLNVFGDSTGIEWGRILETTIDGGEMKNTDLISFASLDHGGTLTNSGGSVNTATVGNDSVLENTGGYVGNASVSGTGQIANVGGLIGKAEVNGGELTNNGGKVTTASISGGAITNTGQISDLTYEGGTYTGTVDGNAGHIGTLNLTADSTGNTWNNVSTANVFQGVSLDSHSMTSGTVNNGGTIDNLAYEGGTYNASFDGGAGSIGTLTLAGHSSDNSGDWGTVGNLEFASNGSGLLTISAFAENAEPAFASVRTMNVSSVPNISYSGIDVQDSVNLSSGNIMLDMSDLGNFGGDWNHAFTDWFGSSLSFATLFGLEEANIFGDTALNSFGLSWGEGNTFFILNDGGIFANDDWSYSVAYAGIVFSGGNEVPEPATLVVLGLGLAGLGLARRRNKETLAA